MSFSRQALIKGPRKAVFQILCDPTVLEEFTSWKVEPLDDEIGEGFRWQERRLLRRREWTMTAFDRRGLTFTAESPGLVVRFAAKKGGTGSCNLSMAVSGDDKAVKRFEKSDGDRLERFRAFLDAPV